MKVACYVCPCCSNAHDFPESDKREHYYCPDCGCEMWYLMSSSKNETTGLYDNYRDENREVNDPKITIVECPYCHSTNTQKLPERTLYFSHRPLIGGKLSEVGKNFHCNKCGADF